MILSKLDKLRSVEEIVKAKGSCCAHCAAVALAAIKDVLSESS